MSEPISRLSTMVKLSKANFAIEEKVFLREIIKFGVPGEEIRQRQRIPLFEPDPFNFGSRPAAPLSRAAPAVDPSDPDAIPRLMSTPVLDTEITLSAIQLIRFDIACKEYSASKTQQAIHRDLLLTHILERLDTDALTALETHIEYISSALLKDTFHIWALVRETNLLDTSANTKHHQIVDFTTLKQTGTFGAYLQAFNRSADLVQAAFESPWHPGYISLEDLKKSIFL